MHIGVSPLPVPALLMHTQTSPTRVWRASSFLRGCFFIVVNRSLPFSPPPPPLSPPSSLGYFPAIIIPSNFAYSRRNDASSTPYLKDEYSALDESPLFLVKWTSFFKEKGKKILPPLMAPVERFNYDGILYRLNRLPREFFFLSLSLFLFQLKRELRTSSLIKI